MNLSNKKVNVLSQGKLTSIKLGSIIKTEFNFKPSSQDNVRKYYKISVTNRKQKQMNMARAGLHNVRRSPGTNRGKSRQKYAEMGTHNVVSGAPNNRKGRKALRFMSNMTKLKCNKKQKKQVIKTMIYNVLRTADLYLMDQPKVEKTSQFINQVKRLSHAPLSNYLKEPKGSGPVLITEPSYSKYFRNFHNVLDLTKSTAYYWLYNGATYRKNIIFTKSDLITFLEKIFNEKL